MSNSPTNGRMAAEALVNALKSLPALVIAGLLLFPAGTSGFLLYRVDQSIVRLANAIDRFERVFTLHEKQIEQNTKMLSEIQRRIDDIGRDRR